MYGATHKVPRSVFPETKILFNFNDSHNEIDWPWLAERDVNQSARKVNNVSDLSN